MSFAKKCPDCGSSNIMYNSEKGETICKSCGLVVEEKMIDFGQEWREFDHDQAAKRRRTGAPMTYSVDAEEPIIVKKGKKLEVIKIGTFVDRLIEKNKNKIISDGHLDYVNIEKEGYEAVSFDNGYKTCFKKISEVSKHPAKKIFDVKLETGKRVRVTGTHSIFTVAKNNIVPIKVSDIKVGQFIVAPKIIPMFNNFNTTIHLVEEFMKISNEHKNIYLRGISDETFFNEIYANIAKIGITKYELKNWRRHKTIPLWALNKVKKVLSMKEFNLNSAKLGIYSGRNELPLKLKIDSAMCRLLGYYVSEGDLSEHTLRFSFGSHEKEYIAEVKNIIKEKFGFRVGDFAKVSANQLEIRSKLLSLLFREVFRAGGRAKEKRVPSMIYGLPRDLKLEFLKAYINGDGSVVVNHQSMNRPQVCISTSSVSKPLTNDIIELYSQLGMHANYQEVFIGEHIINKTSQKIKGSLATRSLITNPDTAFELGYIDFLPARKCKGAIEDFIPAPEEYRSEWGFRKRLRINKQTALDIAEKHNDKQLMKLAYAEFIYLRIKSITEIDSSNGYAYDISVPGCENFVGGQGGIFLHNTKFDKGLGTDVGQKGDIYKLGSKGKNKFFRLRKWQYRISTAIERNLKLALAELKRVASYLKLPKSVEEESARIYTMAVQRGLVRGRSMESVVAGALYAACRRHEVPRTLDELSEASGIDKKEIGRTYRFVTRELGIRILPSNPVDYIPRFASALKISADTQSKAVEILELAQSSELTSGRGPTGIAAASLYVAALTNNEKRTQREVADIAGVTEVTIRNRYKELIKKLNLKGIMKNVKKDEVK